MKKETKQRQFIFRLRRNEEGEQGRWRAAGRHPSPDEGVPLAPRFHAEWCTEGFVIIFIFAGAHFPSISAATGDGGAEALRSDVLPCPFVGGLLPL